METVIVKDLPTAIYIDCPNCNEETIHEIIKGKLSNKKSKETLDCTVKCRNCKLIHRAYLQSPKQVLVPIIVSTMGESEQKQIEVNSNDALEVGDEIILDNSNIKITSMETKDNKRVTAIKIQDLKTIWAKSFDKVRIRVAINKGRTTVSHDIWAVPEEEFYIGNILLLGKLKAVIHRIKTHNKLIKLNGSMATAREIIRIYGRAIR